MPLRWGRPTSAQPRSCALLAPLARPLGAHPLEHAPRGTDLLGDRIAIMAEGELQCCGSSLFLKNRFGAGYRLICTRNAQARCDVAQVAAVLQGHVPEATVLTDVGAEMTFQLPTEAATAFPAMLAQLESELSDAALQDSR